MARSIGPIGLSLAMLVWAAQPDGHARTDGASRRSALTVAPTIAPLPDVGGVVVPAIEDLPTAKIEAEEAAGPRSFYVGDLLAQEVPRYRIEFWVDGVARNAGREWRRDVIEVSAPAETQRRIEEMFESWRECVRRSLDRRYEIKDILEDLLTLRKRHEAKWGTVAKWMNKNDDPKDWLGGFGDLVESFCGDVVRVRVDGNELCVRASPSGHLEVREFFRSYRKNVAVDLVRIRCQVNPPRLASPLEERCSVESRR